MTPDNFQLLGVAIPMTIMGGAVVMTLIYGAAKLCRRIFGYGDARIYDPPCPTTNRDPYSLQDSRNKELSRFRRRV